MDGAEDARVTETDVQRVVEMLRRGIAVDWNGNGPQVAPRGRLLQDMVETARLRAEAP